MRPGVKGSLDLSLIHEAKDVYIDTILKVVNSMPMQDIYTPNIRLFGNSLQAWMAAESIDVYTLPETNELGVKITGLNANFNSAKF